MFDPDSRYADLEVATLEVTAPDGTPRQVRHVRRRFLPPPATDDETLVEHTVAAEDRLDTLTARYLDDPLRSWRVCDANRVMHPLDLTAEVGAVVRIALPRT